MTDAVPSVDGMVLTVPDMLSYLFGPNPYGSQKSLIHFFGLIGYLNPAVLPCLPEASEEAGAAELEIGEVELSIKEFPSFQSRQSK